VGEQESLDRLATQRDANQALRSIMLGHAAPQCIASRKEKRRARHF